MYDLQKNNWKVKWEEVRDKRTGARSCPSEQRHGTQQVAALKPAGV